MPARSPGPSRPVVVLACLGGLAALTFVARRPEPARVDRELSTAVAWLPHRPVPLTMARTVTVAGAPAAALFSAVAADLMLRRRPDLPRADDGSPGRPARPASMVRSGAVLVAGLTARRALSRVVRRQRPPVQGWWTSPHGFSFPSKHATASALAALSVAAPRDLPLGRDPVAVAALLAAGVVGASRLYLGVHWASDVLAGWLFAAAWTAATGPAQHGPGSAPERGEAA